MSWATHCRITARATDDLEETPFVVALMERCLEYGAAYVRALSDAGMNATDKDLDLMPFSTLKQ